MRIWLVTIGEPLPSDSNADRLLRTGMLAEILADRGHEVIWWTSTFDHARKRQRLNHDDVISVAANYSIRLIHAPTYARNIGLRRWRNHRITARRFASAARCERCPDIILCSLPTIELCHEAASFGRRSAVPVVLDVRDLWPDLFVDLAPPQLRKIARFVLSPIFQATRESCAAATAIVGLTQEYLNWGLRYARRSPSLWDRHFAMAYRSCAPSAAALQSAETFWNDRGVVADSRNMTVCFFGTLGRHFDLDCVIDAARRLQAAEARIRFVLCGDGDKLSYHRRRAGGCANVLFPGWVGSAEIWSLMRRSVLGLAPYCSSQNFVMNLPNKPIEYLSAGLPIVSSLQGVLARLLAEHDCGMTYENGNTGQLVRMLLEINGNPVRLSEMSRNSQALYQRQFVAEKVYSEMAQYLEDLAAQYAGRESNETRRRRHSKMQSCAS